MFSFFELTIHFRKPNLLCLKFLVLKVVDTVVVLVVVEVIVVASVVVVGGSNPEKKSKITAGDSPQNLAK